MLYRPPGPRYIRPLSVRNEKSEVSALKKSMLVPEEETKLQMVRDSKEG
jgi:hypothetical protein